jgi:hypothetical protein
MWARPAGGLAGLLVAALGCSVPNPAYQASLVDGSLPRDRGESASGGNDGTTDTAPATDRQMPRDDAGMPEPDAWVPADGLVADQPSPPDAAKADAAPPDVAPEASPADLAPDVVAAPRGTGLLGSYFDGTQLENGTPGCLDLIRVDKVIDFDWPAGTNPGPNMDHDNFSVRWTGELLVPVAGSYAFTTRTDDGVRLYLDDQPVLMNWTVAGASTQMGTKMLMAKRYTIRLEYRESTNAAMAKLSWTPPMQGSQIIPEEFLFPAPRVQLPVKAGCKPTPP